MTNLVKLFSPHGEVYVDSSELARTTRTRLTIYTARGNRLKDVGRTQEIREHARYGVHRDNLYASQKLADAAQDRIWRELFGDNAMTTKQLREREHLLSAGTHTITSNAPNGLRG